MKVMTIFGTRPEIIRLSLIFKLLDERFNHVMVNTSQNYTYELNKIFFKDLQVRKPDYQLKTKTGNYGEEIADIIKNTSHILEKEKPDVLVILGDTNSGLSAIPAIRQGIKVVHLEAGMRSYDERMPEESNRTIIDHISSILLPYTVYSKDNLIRENIHPGKIFVIGNPIVDVIKYNIKNIEQSKQMEKMKLKKNSYFLVTAHRSENVDKIETLQGIFKALSSIQKKYKKRIIFPIHPRTKSKINFKTPKNIELISPLGFFDFTKLEKNALCLLSDSGTAQEEALYFKVPCVTIRKTTERPETIEAGSNIISGLEPKNIIASVETALTLDKNWEYELGDGKTSPKVINIIHSLFE
jgi:UDP-N-acetylglucosamine 2-epimerase (non-hydrolysing)